MNKVFRTLFSLAGALFAVCYVGVMFYRYHYTPYKTETVVSYTMDDSLTARAVFIRSETAVPAVGGVLSYRVSDGEWVLAGSVVADVFLSESDLARQADMERLEAEIAGLEAAEPAAHSGVNTVNALSAAAREQLAAITRAAAYGQLGEGIRLIPDLTLSLNRKQAAIGGDADFSQRAAVLGAELERLRSGARAAQGTVTAPQTGYYSSVTDGYEALLSPSAPDADEAAAQLLSGREEAEPTAGAGKIVTTHNAFVALIADADALGRFYEGAQLRLAFSEGGGADIGAAVTRLTPLEGGGTLVVMRISHVSGFLLSRRTAAVTVKFDTLSGLRIPASALRYIGAQAGVYVLANDRLVFKPVSLIYEGGGFLLCAPADPTAPSPLRMYDSAVTSGTDLYDGKVVR